jgi:hypothetical protein
MPSPFPGMDPYLERSDLWPELHGSLMWYLRDTLQPLLPENYFARVDMRIYTQRDTDSSAPQPRKPDLELVLSGTRQSSGAPAFSQEDGAAREGFWIEPAGVERREPYLVIRTVPDGELVTAVEMLSPTNKGNREGREAYARKQREFLEARVNLVEIDWLRAGRHMLAVPEADCAHLPSHHYRYCVFRSVRPWGFWLDVWTVHQPIPILPIPLLPEDGDIRVEIQSLYDRAYDYGAFRKQVDYSAEPVPPLSGDDAAWAGTLLREAGLRNGESA